MKRGITMTNDLKLTDIFDLDSLQELQDNFFAATGISCGISDANGVAITKHCSCSRFCSEYIKNTPLGLECCQRCDKEGTQQAKENGETIIYTCHAGLLDFAAPIVVEDQLLGCFLGGQVLQEPLDEEMARNYALELGIDPDEYVAAAKELPIYSIEHLRNSANFLYSIGNMLSHIAYKKYNIQQASTEIEREANMKSDFLANMSHEIRTPMNGVIGMAEMALREELPPAAREYINQIKASGNTLLTIINDILDFSKISSGKMNINLVEYELLSTINDIVNIIATRIGDKKLELIVDFDPNIPYQLMGDNIRIKQIIMNLTNNAIKFTPKGYVKLNISYRRENDYSIVLCVSVSDTGIGIKKEDQEKLFQSFQQVDSKRNRNIEGSGLGLAISKQLVLLMNGKIWLESEYGVGSTFYFEIPQIVLKDHPSIEIQDTSHVVATLCDNSLINQSIEVDLQRLGIKRIPITTSDSLDTLLEQQVDFLFIDHPLYSDQVQKFVQEHPSLTAVLMTEFQTAIDCNMSNMLVVKKPIYSLNISMLLNHKKLYMDYDSTRSSEFTFTAPEADILIVDDNEVNLTVAAGLMEPLQMNIDTALSGKEAIDKITVKHYDLIFMDHMMPGLDGIETTHIIRRFHEEYNVVPIIALTANVVEEMRSMFLCEGMNDIIAKPIEMTVLISKLKQWLPKDKIKKFDSASAVSTNPSADKSSAEDILPVEIPGIDMDTAIHYLGTKQFLAKVLKDFYKAIDRKSAAIETFYETQDWGHYTIDVHALKSSSKQIGAMTLSEMAANLEKAGSQQDVEFLQKHTPLLLEEYRGFKDILQPYFPEETESKPKSAATPETLLELFNSATEALDNLDMDAMENYLSMFLQYHYPPQQNELCQQLQEAVDNLDAATCEDIIKDWEDIVRQSIS